MTSPGTARLLWSLAEPFHALTYFAEEAQAAFEDIMAVAVELGGTITGEHGVGRLKRDALPAQLGPEVMALTRRVKDALDPQGILNPGVLL